MRKIGGLLGLKVLFLFLIYWTHSGIVIPMNRLGLRPDFGMVGCTFFFVAAGFLVAYKHHQEWVNAALDLPYFWNKIKIVWPLHLVTFIICFSLMPARDVFAGKTWAMAVVNLSLLQSLCTGATRFSFNGVSWFLSALMLCYLVGPILMRYVVSKRHVALPFLILVLLRWMFEWLCLSYPGLFVSINFHTSGFVRILDYLVGMAVYPIFESIERRVGRWDVQRRALVFGGLECFALFGLVFWIVPCCFCGGRALLPLWLSVVLLIYSFDFGFLSKILSSRLFVVLSSIELEVFMFHQAIMKLWRAKLVSGFGMLSGQILLFLIVIAVAVAWHVLYAKFRHLMSRYSIKVVRR